MVTALQEMFSDIPSTEISVKAKFGVNMGVS